MVKRGLGRGLGSLFGDYAEEEELVRKKVDEAATKMQSLPKPKATVISGDVSEIELSLIDRNENQPRKKFDEKAMIELAQSIKTYGIVQPLLLTKRDERYLIVAGERRFRAARIAGLKSVPAVVKDLNDQEVSEIALVENLQRENLNAIESARAIQELIERHGLTQEKVADRIGKSRPAVANTLRLLTLCKGVIELVEADALSPGHARVLVAITDSKKQLEIAQMAVKGKISVREMERYVRECLKPKKEVSHKPSQSADLKDFMNRMQEKFGTKVTILGNDRKGRIFIDYYSVDDLNRINDLINKL